jgi:hypothetical protein
MKRTILYCKIIGILLLIAGFISCSKKKELPLKEELPFSSLSSLSNEPGFGDSDSAALGTPFELPQGLHLVSRPNHPFDPDLSNLHGIINTFYADVNIVADSTWSGGEVVFPVGLVFMETAPGRIQNGMLMDRVALRFPPYRTNGGRDTTTMYLGLACMNEGKGLPFEENNEPDTRNYLIGKNMHTPTVVTTNVQVLNFLSLLQNKPHLKLNRHFNPRDAYEPDYQFPEWMEPYAAIQSMFWKLTDGNGLEEADIRELLKTIEKK